MTSIRGRRFSSQTKRDSCKYCAFAASVFSDNEIDKGSKFDIEMFMTHEIIALDAFKYAMISGHIGLVAGEGIFLLDDLCRSYFKFVFVVEGLGDVRIGLLLPALIAFIGVDARGITGV